MNIQIADRLIQLRKNHGFSQEALAEKLGISRQAVSKWERAEASPDTDNLIALAEIYGMTLDQLLDTSRDTYVVGGENKNKKEKMPLNEIQLQGKKLLKIFPIMAFAIVAFYVAVGFLFDMWSPLWIIFLFIPLFFTTALALLAGRTKRIAVLLLTGSVALLAVIVFLFAGMLFDLWAVAWIVFLAIHVYAYLAFILTKSKTE